MKSVVRITIGCLIVGALFLFGKGVLAYQSPGKPTGFVNDFANVLTVDQKTSLENTLSNFQKETSNEISIVTIPTLNNEPIESYANTLFREWGIGGKDRNNGVLILAAIDDRKLRIEVGYGLEGALPDLLTKQIQENEIVPSFKDGNYANGLQKGVTAVMQATQGEYQNSSQQKNSSIPTELIFFILFFGAQVIFAILAPTKSWWLGGVIGGIGGGVLGFILSSFVFGIIAGLFGVVIGLLVDYVVSKNYKGPDDHSGGPWFFGGGGSSFGGGFGGFGGGSSGGGGSNSNW